MREHPLLFLMPNRTDAQIAFMNAERGLASVSIHCGDNMLDRRDIGSIAREDFMPQLKWTPVFGPPEPEP